MTYQSEKPPESLYYMYPKHTIKEFKCTYCDISVVEVKDFSDSRVIKLHVYKKEDCDFERIKTITAQDCGALYFEEVQFERTEDEILVTADLYDSCNQLIKSDTICKITCNSRGKLKPKSKRTYRYNERHTDNRHKISKSNIKGCKIASINIDNATVDDYEEIKVKSLSDIHCCRKMCDILDCCHKVTKRLKSENPKYLKKLKEKGHVVYSGPLHAEDLSIDIDCKTFEFSGFSIKCEKKT